MGKRRSEDAEETQSRKQIKEESEDSTCGSFVLPEEIYNDARDSHSYSKRKDKKQKKSKKNVSFEMALPESDSDMDTGVDAETNGVNDSKLNGSSASSKNFMRNGAIGDVLNASVVSSRSSPVTLGGDSENFTIYLIRKPIEVSIEDLEAIKLPTNPAKKKKMKLENAEGRFSVRSGDKCSQMFHVPNVAMLTVKDASKLKPTGLISSQVNISRVMGDLPGGPVLEDGEELPDDMDMIMPIKAIKKSSSLKMDHLNERLKAYGVLHKNKKRRQSLPCLREQSKNAEE